MSKGKSFADTAGKEVTQSFQGAYTGVNNVTGEPRASYEQLVETAGSPVLGRWIKAAVAAAQTELKTRHQELRNYQTSGKNDKTAINSILNGTTERSVVSKSRG